MLREMLVLRLALGFRGRIPRPLQRRGPTIGSKLGLNVGQLAGLQGHKLIASLRRLQGARRGLARDVPYHPRLQFQRILEPAHGILPARLRLADQGAVGHARRDRCVGLLVLLLDGLDAVGNILRLREQGRGLGDRRLQRRECRKRQVRQIAALVDQHLRLIGQ